MPNTTQFDVELSSKSIAMIDRLRELAPYKIPLAIKRGVDKAVPEVISSIKNDRLSGKGPFPVAEHKLGEVTGTLKNSVSPMQSKMETSSDSCTITGGIQVIGCPYARVHEFGFAGDESVRAHSRQIVRVRTKSLSTGRLLKRPVKTSSTSAVKSFTRHANIPERAPFRFGLRENLIKVRNAIDAELGRTLSNV